jgi:hypothetical protein
MVAKFISNILFQRLFSFSAIQHFVLKFKKLVIITLAQKLFLRLKKRVSKMFEKLPKVAYKMVYLGEENWCFFLFYNSLSQFLV